MNVILTKDIKFIFSTILLLVGITACEKYLDHDGTELGALSPTKIDDTAGSWKTYTSMTLAEFAVPAIVPTPEIVTSSKYLQEIEEVKAEVAKIDDARRDAIRYWNGGGILRWNQIMRELVAKNNLPPAEDANGKYPVPSSADPDNLNGTGTAFPFSNPPYAARAYAYVSVAQYDALVAAIGLKKQYNRKTPNAVDASITPIIVSAPKLSSYPSEDAVMAAVTYEFMKRLFPQKADTLYLYKKKEEQKWFKMWAGVSTRSDIEAGERLGKAVFAKVFARFRTDGMANAVGTQVKWDSLTKRIEEKGEIAWKSLEDAPRPPMLPFYGNVGTWNMDKATLNAISISVPPLATKSTEFQAQVAEVRSYTDNPTRENIAIVHYWADGAGTHTPPGHWNQIAEKYIVAAKQSEVRTARNYALLNTAMMDAAISCWYTKSYYYFPRPTQMDSNIKTLTGLPNFPSYTSGHSTFSSAAATVLSYLFPDGATTFQTQAQEASMSRLYGGIHYKMDCDGGLKIGKAVGDKAVLRGQSDGVQ
ncbi:MAG: phosphatase PAP2 family protein [Bacteroidota bacterium]